LNDAYDFILKTDTARRVSHQGEQMSVKKAKNIGFFIFFKK